MMFKFLRFFSTSKTFHGVPNQNLSHGDRPLGLLELFIPRVDGITEDGFYDDPPSPLFWMLRSYGSLDVMATDEFGSQFLRKFLDRATFHETVTVFRLVFHHFIQLATDQFGNFFVHKFLEVCNEEEKTNILCMIISKPRRMVKISVNSYGRRVVHKLIEAVRTKEQMIHLLLPALNPAFLSLVREYHVIQRFLRPLNHNDNINKVIFEEAAMRLCTEIATHRHGSCELKRCVSYSLGAHPERLAAAPFGHL